MMRQIFKDLRVPVQCPKPIILQDPAILNNTDDDQNVAKELFVRSTCYFSPKPHPTSGNSVYETNKRIIMAMMNCNMPTLYGRNEECAKLKELKLENMCPLQFSFVLGRPSENKETLISAK